MSFKLNTQHWGDSFKLMPHVQDGLADMVLYSPPYITGKGYEDDTSSGIAAYKDASDRMFAEVARVLKSTGVFALEVGYFQHPAKGLDPKLWQGKNTIRPMMYELWPILEKHGLHLVREIIWHFRGGRTGHPSDRCPFNRHEYIAILSPDPANIHFSKEELRDLENNVSYSKRNNKFGAAPTSIWSDDATTNAKLREILKSVADGMTTEDEARLAAMEALANLLAPGVTGAVDELMRLATKLKPDAPPRAKALLDANSVIGDTFNDETNWLIERVTGADDSKYHECPFPPGLVTNAIRQFCPPGGVVLDPYAGSCTVGKGALMAGRKFLAFERDEYWRTAVTNEMKYLKWLLKTWLEEGTDGLARGMAPDAPGRLPDPPCPDVLTYAGDDLDLRIRCLHARRALQAFYLDKMRGLVTEMRRKGALPKKKGGKHEEIISESGLCPCTHCQTWLH